MAKQSDGQKIGSEGHSFVEYICRKSRKWIARKQDEDFGIDMELEPSLEEVSGHFLKCQIKTHQCVDPTKKKISEPLDKSFLRYAYECKLPVILIVVSLDTDESWYVWIQNWLLSSNRVKNIYNKKDGTLSIRLDRKQTLKLGLEGELLSIAKWEHMTQLHIAVKDLAAISSKLYDEKLAKMLFEYLCNVKNPDLIDTSYFDLLIDKAIDLENRLWATSEGNEISPQLYGFIRNFGNLVSSKQIEKLVVRGDRCSRTGIIALSLIFDKFPSHAMSLKLAKKFKDLPDPTLHFYCSLREKYLGTKSPGWIIDNLDNLVVGNLKFYYEKDEILNKWANRGDSIILDYTYIVA